MPNPSAPPGSMSPNDVVRHWVKSAKANWKTTRFLFEKRDYVSALFFAHLYLEKLLKAHVVQHTRIQAPFGHNLRFLADKAGLQLSTDRAVFLDRVTEYNMAGRYDDWLFEFKKRCTRKYCQRDLDEIERIGKWLLRMLQL